jgi:hypothetical protein
VLYISDNDVKPAHHVLVIVARGGSESWNRMHVKMAGVLFGFGSDSLDFAGSNERALRNLI